MISVVIPVSRYTEKLRLCLKLLMKNNYKDFEVVVVYQGKSSIEADKINIPKKFLRLIKIEEANLSRAYNIGARHSKGNIIAFISDDCYTRSDWLLHVHRSFMNNFDYCVTGNTYPYLKSRSNRDDVCYCTFNDLENKSIYKPCYHATQIGFSNNFAIKKRYLMKLGGFREIFSPGKLGIHACDADLFLRILIDKKTIRHNPKMIVWHDHWLKQGDALLKYLQYVGGEVACYGLYALKGQVVGWEVLHRNFFTIPLNRIKRAFFLFIKGKIVKSFAEIRILFWESLMRVSAFFRALLIFFAGY